MLLLLSCGVLELAAQRALRLDPKAHGIAAFAAAGERGHQRRAAVGGVGGVQGRSAVLRRRFVITPLMQADAVSHYRRMTGAQFLNAVALGQITPGPVVQTGAILGSTIPLARALIRP